MKPEHLDLLQLPGRPAVTPDGTVLVAVSRPDPEHDRYVGHLHRVTADGITEFTRGPRDSAPILSPDGHTLVFLRAAGSGPAQLYSVDLRGGEPRSLADHPLGASNPVFAPDGSGIAYLAAVPEPGRYGTDDDVAADGEPPRRIDRLAYRLDGKGFTGTSLRRCSGSSWPKGPSPSS